MTENEAQNLVVQGFLEIFTKELPMEYALEFNRLVRMQMEGTRMSELLRRLREALRRLRRGRAPQLA